ncbi:MAG TPA: solute carrier family 23 protein [Microlunatus sp.]
MSTTVTPAPRAKKQVHPVDEVPPIPKLLTYGFQHVAAFYAGAVVVPIIIGGVLGLGPEAMITLIQADLFTCGIASLLQAVGIWKIGVRLPLLQGVAFAGVAPIISIGLGAGGGEGSLPTIFGAVMIGGLLWFVLAPFIGKLVRFFPPVVTGSVLTVIGTVLIPVAAADAVGGQLGLPGYDFFANYSVANASQGGTGMPNSSENMAYALGTLILILLLTRFFRGFLQTIAVLLGLIVGSLVYFISHPATDFSTVTNAGWIKLSIPFHYGAPEFKLSAILGILIVMVITAVETVGSLYATGEIVHRRIKSDDISRALRADGAATFLGGMLGSFPYTCFAENIGLVRITGVKSRWVVATAGCFMIVLGLFPKAAAIVAMIPHPVLGGAALSLFAAVAIVGIQTLSSVDFNDHRNLAVAGTSIAVALYVTAFPAVQQAAPSWLQWYFSGGISAGAFTAILLNLLFFHLPIGNKSPAVKQGAGGALITLEDINQMSEDEFERTFSSVVQGQKWVLDRAWGLRPFATTADLNGAFAEALVTGSNDEQNQLINSFADLGSEDAEGNSLTSDHARGALANLQEDDYNDVVELASAYREHFGFPLIISAKEHDRFERLLAAGWDRMDNSPITEHHAAMIEISKIVNFRFRDLVANANPIAAARFGRFADLNT